MTTSLIVTTNGNTKRLVIQQVPNRLEITNYKPKTKSHPSQTPANPGDIRVFVKNEKMEISRMTRPNASISDIEKEKFKPEYKTHLGSLDVNDDSFIVIKKIVNLSDEGHGKPILSAEDLRLAYRYQLKDLKCVEKVARDDDAGVTTVHLKNGNILRFDVESDIEKTERIKKEKDAKAEAAKKQAEAAKKAAEQPKEKSFGDKVIECIGNFLDWCQEKYDNWRS